MPPAKKRKPKNGDRAETPPAALDAVAPPQRQDDEETEALPVRVNGKTGQAAAAKPSTSRLNRRALLIALGCIAFLAVTGVAVWFATRPGETPTPVANTNTTPIDPTLTATRLLDGTPVSPETAVRWPLAVMFDNLAPARPQSGLGSARIVYETLAEGGATRFMGLFDGTENPSRLGPVRSARHYFINLAEEYRAVYIHAGQSPQAAETLRTSKTTNANFIGSAARYAYRVKDRPAPHNLYSDDAKLTFMMRDFKLDDKPATFAPWTFVPEPALAARPTDVLTISVKFSSLSFQADWRYDRDRNVFLRSTGGQPHVDALTNEQMVAKNVVVMRVPAETNLGEKGRIDIKVTGEGQAQMFRDGAVVEGTWKKPTLNDRLRFYDAAGAEIPFHPGSTWIEVVPGDREVVVGKA